MNRKIVSYLGFAKKSGKLMSGVNTCSYGMAKGKIKLMILTEDISENSSKKIMKEIRRYNVKHISIDMADELSQAIGESGRSVFGICDKGFADAIIKVVSEESSKEVVE